MSDALLATAEAIGTRCVYCSTAIRPGQLVRPVGLRFDHDHQRWGHVYVHDAARQCDFQGLRNFMRSNRPVHVDADDQETSSAA